MLERRAARQGAHVALIDEATGAEWTIADLERSGAAVAAALITGGVGPGDRVGLLSANHPSMVVTYLAVARARAVLVPLNWRLTAAELEVIGADAGLSAIVAAGAFAAPAQAGADAVGVAADRPWRLPHAADGFRDPEAPAH